MTIRLTPETAPAALIAYDIPDYTKLEVMAYVDEYMNAEGSSPSRALRFTLANQALRIISRETKFYEKTWDNSVTGALTIVGNVITLPNDCLEVKAVEWDGSDNPLKKRSAEQMYDDNSEWRDETGDPEEYVLSPTSITLGSTPSDVTGKLVVRGKAYLPNFLDEDDAVNPLAFLPAEFQLLPAYYMLKMFPVVLVNRSKEEIMLSVERRDMHAALWDEGNKNLRELAEQRKFEGLSNE